jgi:hypothetical protein
MTVESVTGQASEARRRVDLLGLDGDVNGVIARFGIETVAVDHAAATVRMTMPLAGALNPITGRPTIAPLAVLVDAAAVVNHFLRADDQWTVTTELSIDMTTDFVSAATDPDADPSVIDARVVGATSVTSSSVRAGVPTTRASIRPRRSTTAVWH